ncbi:bacteriorhodopsin [Halovenus sp. WSH3]|uniref:Bacteriorhodopsin n=1 Tax=Halovenus carboxidivorans TaxID=2692199 RepID=A0A6B0TBA9_9EURY|nr:bacteriorhodopsin [Halovenus carboxidivorans]MXR50469.1 bacteriorhodopsin [Halovenus carboxidivorans]
MVDAAVWFGIGASVFFTAAVLFVLFAVQNGSIRSPFYFLPPVIAAVAGTAYVGMYAVESGTVDVGVGLEALRFADWMVTTPLITYYLGRLAGVERATKLAAVLANVVMIALGYVFVTQSGTIQWIAFSASTICFVALVYLFAQTFSSALIGASRTSRSLFISLRDLTIATWAIYPVVYFLGPIGLGAVQAGDLSFLITTLDIAAKVGLMSIILFRQYTLNTFLSYDVPTASQ